MRTITHHPGIKLLGGLALISLVLTIWISNRSRGGHRVEKAPISGNHHIPNGSAPNEETLAPSKPFSFRTTKTRRQALSGLSEKDLQELEEICLKEFETVKSWELNNFEDLKDPAYRFYGDVAVFLPQFPPELYTQMKNNIQAGVLSVVGQEQAEAVGLEVLNQFEQFLCLGQSARLVGANDYSTDDVLIRTHFIANRDALYINEAGTAILTALGGTASPMARNHTCARYMHIFQPVDP